MTKYLIVMLLLVSQSVLGQRVLELPIDEKYVGQSLAIMLEEISTEQGATFFYLPEWLEDLSINTDHTGLPLGNVLDQLFQGTDLVYLEMYPNSIVIVKDPSQALLRRETIEKAIAQGKIIIDYQLGAPGANTPETVEVTGKISDWSSQDPLPFASIAINDTVFVTSTDSEGHYRLVLSPGEYVMEVGFLGYEEKIIVLAVYENGIIDFELEKESTELEEVVVEGKQSLDVSTSGIGKSILNLKEIKRAPAFLGEADMVKQVQIMAGVTTVGEAATGFNVRGGSVDQNLILFDGLPVFNSSHALGFVTAISPEAVQNVTFYKGGIPAKYGGRTSSVLDIQSRDGDLEKWTGKIGLGMITSNGAINGPLKEGRTGLSASFRTTYSNWLVRAIKTDYANLGESSVSFYDGSVKLTHKLTEQTNLSVTGYRSADSFSITGDTTFKWNNLQFIGRVDHRFSEILDASFSLGRSSYGYNVLNQINRTASDLSYNIATTIAEANFDLDKDDHQINFGWQISHYRFKPGSLRPDSPNSNAAEISLDKQYSIENALYIMDEWAPPNGRLFVEAGLRLPMFFSFGAATINEYAEGSPRQITDKIGVIDFGGGEVIKTYLNVEPRLSARWMFDPNTSIKAGLHRIYQNLHLVTNTAAVTPIDIWQPSGYYFEPQRSDQVSIGLFRDTENKTYAYSVEGFYKWMNNVLDFKDGARLILNDHLETDLLQGKGYSYGIETTASKNEGRLTGSVNYTYSRAFRKFDSPLLGRSVNDGNAYPANFDQPHIVNLSWKYQFTRRYFLTGNFTYHTGRPVSIPLSAYNLENTTLAFFSERNQYRIPDYHRLDIAFVMEGNHRRADKAKSSWIISVYNVYARKNPYSIFFRNSGIGVPRPYQLSIIGTAFPSLSYNLEFK